MDESTIFEVLRGGAGVLTLAALLLGVLAAAGEHRHATIVPALLVSPRREQLLAAKLGGQAAQAVVLSLAVSAVGLVVGTAYLATRDVRVDLLSSDVLLMVAATTVVVTLYAIAGAAVGAVVRNQTAAVAGVLMWVFVIENAIPPVLRRPGLKRWLPGGLSDRLLHVAEPLAGTGSAWLVLAVLVGATAVLAAAAFVTARTTDVS